MDIFPERRSFAATGHYMLVNRTDKPIDEIHVTEARESVDEVRFDRPFHNKLNDKKYFYEIYTLDQPLQPGETMRMDFRVSRNTKGFLDGGERPELAYNGTFFDRDYFPLLGYSQQIELDDPVRRREEKLGELPDMAPRGDPYYSNVDLFAPDSEWVTFHCVVSTSSDQIAIAPGYLKREWTENRPPLLRVRHGRNAGCQLLFISLGPLRGKARQVEEREPRGLLQPRATNTTWTR